MNILVVGAAGHVGGILKPALEANFDCRWFDLRPVAGAEDRSVVGSVTDAAALQAAARECGALVQLAMANWRHDEPARVDLSYDVHVKGMHRVLEAAVAVGAKRVVYASSLSIYDRWGSHPGDWPTPEERPPDCADLYGLTKRLGEEVCRAFAKRHDDLCIVALRLVRPISEEQLAAGPEKVKPCWTGPWDLGRAFVAAIERDLPPGFHPINIASDPDEVTVRLRRAREQLGWWPEMR